MASDFCRKLHGMSIEDIARGHPLHQVPVKCLTDRMKDKRRCTKPTRFSSSWQWQLGERQIDHLHDVTRDKRSKDEFVRLLNWGALYAWHEKEDDYFSKEVVTQKQEAQIKMNILGNFEMIRTMTRENGLDKTERKAKLRDSVSKELHKSLGSTNDRSIGRSGGLQLGSAS